MKNRARDIGRETVIAGTPTLMPTMQCAKSRAASPEVRWRYRNDKRPKLLDFSNAPASVSAASRLPIYK